MLTTLACPICLTARERETIGLQRPTVCPDCGGWYQLAPPAPRTLPILAIVCQDCRCTYSRLTGAQPHGTWPICPQCGATPGRVLAANPDD